MSFQLRIAHTDTAVELFRLIQAWAIRTALVIMVSELNRIVLPPADFTEPEGSGWLLVERVVPTTGTGEALAHGCVKYINALIE